MKRLERKVLKKLRESNLLPSDSEQGSETDTDEDSGNEKEQAIKETKKVRRIETKIQDEGATESIIAHVNRLTKELGRPKCYECGSTEHFRAQCPLNNPKENANENEEVEVPISSKQIVQTTQPSQINQTNQHMK